MTASHNDFTHVGYGKQTMIITFLKSNKFRLLTMIQSNTKNVKI